MALLSSMFIGTRNDVSKLTCSLVELENDLSSPFKLKSVLALPGRINRVSLAYCTIRKSPPKSSERGCLRTPFCQALLTIDWSRSAAKIKRRGDNGSRCLTPLMQLKGLLGIPLRRTEELLVLRRFLIQLTHFSKMDNG